MKTAAEIDDLKAQWRADPIWDIEETPGFEAHYEELYAYHERCRKEWGERRHRMLMDKAEKLGVPGNKQFASYIENLEHQIDRLYERLESLEG